MPPRCLTAVAVGVIGRRLCCWGWPAMRFPTIWLSQTSCYGVHCRMQRKRPIA